MSQSNEYLFDHRIVEKNIRKGLITRKQYEDHLKSLSDAEGNAEYVSLEDEGEDEGEGEVAPEAVVEA